MKRFVLAGFLSLALTIPSYACTYTWTAPTTNTDGSALTDLAQYVLYKDGVVYTSVLAPAVSYSEVGICRVGSYKVTAVNMAGKESDPSNTYVVTKPGNPKNFTVTK